jgi:hypothetical protein
MKSQDRVKLCEFNDNRVRLESISGNKTNLNRGSDKIINFGIKASERHVNPYHQSRERVSVKRVQRAVVHSGQFSEDRVSASDNKINLGRVSDIKASLGRVSDIKVNRRRVSDIKASLGRVSDIKVNLGRVSDIKVNLGRVSDSKVNLGHSSDKKVSRVCDDRVKLLRGSGDIRDATSLFRTG